MAELDLGTFTEGAGWAIASGDPIADLNSLANEIRSQRPAPPEMVVRYGLRAVWDELIRCGSVLPPPRFVAVSWLSFRQPRQERERSSGCLNLSAQKRNADRVAVELEREQLCFVNRVTGVVHCSPRVVAEVRAALEVACG